MSSLIKGMKVYLVEPIDDINQLKNQFQPYIDAGLDLSVGPYVSERNKGFSEQDLIRIGNEYDAVIGMSREKFTRDIIMASDRLKMIGKTGIGIDHIDINAATEKGIVVTNTPNLNALSVSEHAISLMLALLKKLPKVDAHLRAGYWRDGSTLADEVYHNTIGIVGFGNIGRGVAKRLQGWDCTLIAYDPYVTQEQADALGWNVKMVDWETLFATSDAITIHTPLNEETRGFVGEREFKMMKRTAVLVNTARGPIVNRDALNNALRSGEIAGAGIDTHVPEPVGSDYPLLDLHENVVLTTHNAGWARPALCRLAEMAAKNTIETLSGNICENICNPEVEKLWRTRFGY